MEFNIVSLLHSVRVLRLSANVKFVFNIVRIFNSERDFPCNIHSVFFACAGILDLAY